MSLVEDLPSFFKKFSLSYKFYISRDKMRKTELIDKIITKICDDGRKFDHPVFKNLPNMLKIERKQSSLTAKQVKKLQTLMTDLFLLIRRHAK